MFEMLLHQGQCAPNLSYEQGLGVSLFLGGLVSGFSHCALMCGPFVISQSQNLEKARSALLFPYHFGRITTYVVLSIVTYSLFSLTFLFAPIKNVISAPMLFTAALFFLVMAFPKLSQYPFFFWMNIRYPQKLSQMLSKALSKTENLPDVLKQYTFGLLLGFMPCGMVFAALLAATTAPSATGAAGSMIAFGLGTIPALVLTAFSGRFFVSRLQQRYGWIKKIPLIVSSFWLCILAGSLLITG